MTGTKTIIEALRILARDMQSDDGVANAAIAEAADRLEKQQRRIRNQRREIEKLRNGLGEKPKCELCDGHGGLAITGPPGPHSPVVPCPRCNP